MQTIFEPALILMVSGMGFVFIFLTVLVGVTHAMSRIVNRFFPDPDPVPVKAPMPQPSSGDPNLPVVIAAAVKAYRSRHPK